MEIDEIKKKIKESEYDFLRTDKRLSDNIILLTLSGSYAYGTNVEGSDIDIRGCALNSRYEILTNSNFEQVCDTATDTTIYSFNKLVKLLTTCNPNTIELLGCKKEHYIYLSEEGKKLIDNRHMFLSKKAMTAFAGYASQQLRRLQNSIAKDTYEKAEKERHILGSVNSAIRSFNDRYASFENGRLKAYIEKDEIIIDADLKGYPLRDYKNMVLEMQSIVKEYDKLNKRNNKKDAMHLNKHAMHLIRLHLMCIDILEKEEIITYREDEHKLLMDIRSGKYMHEDGSYDKSFFEILDEYEKRLLEAYKNTRLADEPDYDGINKMIIDTNERVVLNYVQKLG